MNLNYLKIIVLFVSLLVSVSYAAPIDVTINFYENSSDSNDHLVGTGLVTYDPEQFVCFATGQDYYDYCGYVSNPPGGWHSKDSERYGRVSNFSAAFLPFSSITQSFEDHPGFTYNFNLFETALLNRRDDLNDNHVLGYNLEHQITIHRVGTGWNLRGDSDNDSSQIPIEIFMDNSGKWSLTTGSLAEGGSQTEGYFTLSTPIPATAWLFASGLIGLFGFRRK